jgi:hypothetical protein
MGRFKTKKPELIFFSQILLKALLLLLKFADSAILVRAIRPDPRFLLIKVIRISEFLAFDKR